MRLLVHACCAPCLLAPARILKEEGVAADVFWYNPNVHPYREYEKRLAALEALTARDGLRLIVEDRYDVDYFLREVVKARDGRCPRCYAERLSVTAGKAREGGYDAFSTTLLISRHQDHDAIREAGENAALHAGVLFLYRDWRTVDAESHRAARDSGLYLQGYCGCIYSEEERYRKRDERPGA